MSSGGALPLPFYYELMIFEVGPPSLYYELIIFRGNLVIFSMYYFTLHQQRTTSLVPTVFRTLLLDNESLL